MSDVKNLNDFFAQNSKKKQKKKPAAKAQNAAASSATPAEEIKEEVKETIAQVASPTQAAAQEASPQLAQNQAADFGDSSDDDDQIVINDGKQKVIDRKEIEASKKNEDDKQNDPTAGWNLAAKFGQQPDTSAQAQSSFASSAKAPGAGGSMNFSKGKPTFSRRGKGIMADDFPDLDQAANGGAEQAQQSKANSAMIFTRGAATTGARAPGESFGGEEKKAATKPVFRGKAKLGGASNEEVQNSRMNYDFSRMNMSAATSGKKEGEEGQDGQTGERRGEGNRTRQGAGAQAQRNPFGDDDDFEVVREKPKKQPRQFEEPSFDGGKPMFTRGGSNRQQ